MGRRGSTTNRAVSGGVLFLTGRSPGELARTSTRRRRLPRTWDTGPNRLGEPRASLGFAPAEEPECLAELLNLRRFHAVD